MHIPVRVFTRDADIALTAFLRTKPAGESWAIVSEGLLPFEAPGSGFDTQTIAGCACCVGNLALQVALTRLIRRVRPARIIVVTATADHLARVFAALRAAQYSPHLQLDPSSAAEISDAEQPKR